MRVFPSHANYVLVELLDGISARELTKQLLLGHDMLLKDLSAKIRLGGRQFVRIAVRSADANRELVEALEALLGRDVSALRAGAGE